MNKLTLNMVYLLILALALVCQPCAFAQSAAESEDDDEAEIRENPEFEADSVGNSAPAVNCMDYAAYPFLHLNANRIETNGADWSGLAGMFEASTDTLISIVHIGDSHIQAEGSTSRTRELLQSKYGSAGRGLIIPFRLAGTNQPTDYSITSPSKFETAKILKKPWPFEMGFTGIALRPVQRKFEITIEVKPKEGDSQAFDVVKIFTHGGAPLVTKALTDGKNNLYESFTRGDSILVFLNEPATNVNLHFQSRGRCEIYGFDLDNSYMGVKYSAIGNNGATYSAYNAIGNVGEGIKSLSPNLIIVALGTNEAFGKVSDATMYSSIDILIKDLQKSNPGALMLLVTPAECQKGSSRRVGKGRKRRRVTSYAVNPNVARMRQVILRYGKDKGIATYDWYDVAGGSGSSDKWVVAQLMAKDHIHDTWSGYALHGSLFYDALIELITKK